MAGEDLSAQRLQPRGQGVGDRLGPTLNERRAVGAGGDGEREPEAAVVG